MMRTKFKGYKGFEERKRETVVGTPSVRNARVRC